MLRNFILFYLTTLLNKLQQQYKIIQNIGDKQNYIPRAVYPNGKSANGPMRGAPHELQWQDANYTYTLTKSTNRKYNEKCYKDYELWHELGTMYTACPRVFFEVTFERRKNWTDFKLWQLRCCNEMIVMLHGTDALKGAPCSTSPLKLSDFEGQPS